MKSENKTFNDFNNFLSSKEKLKGKLVKWYYDMFNVPIKDLL